MSSVSRVYACFKIWSQKQNASRFIAGPCNKHNVNTHLLYILTYYSYIYSNTYNRLVVDFTTIQIITLPTTVPSTVPPPSGEKFEMFVDFRCPIRVECILSCSTTSAFCPANPARGYILAEFCYSLSIVVLRYGIILAGDID